MEHIDHVRRLVGVDHIGIGSDFKGMKKYTAGFGREANFEAIAIVLGARGYSEKEIMQIRGGNFFRLWQVVNRE